MPRSAEFRRQLLGLTPIFLVAGAVLILPGQPASAGDGFDSFDALRRHHAQTAFEATAAYLSAHPDAPDADTAYEFLFETALDFGLVREARPHAVRFLKDHPDAGVSDQSRARRVAMLALALEGQTGPAIDVLGEELAAVRRLDPSAAIDAATALAAAVQRGGKPTEAAQVYERLRRAFFLNAGVEAVVENRLARLALLDQPAPPIGIPDLDERAVAPEDLAGKVVLIDFWATNCPPCLAELPELRRLYADHHDAGFEILAVSLDEEEATLREYLSRNPLPWRVFLSTDDGDATREAFGVETIPANFLVGPDGKVTRVDLHGADLRAEVERLLETSK